VSRGRHHAACGIIVTLTDPGALMLDPQVRQLLDLMVRRGVPPMHTMEPVQARLSYRDRRFLTQPDSPPLAYVVDLNAPGPAGPIPLRHYRPDEAALDTPLPTLIYLHGGGWVVGDLDTHDTLCRELCRGSGCAVIAVDYRMGPEAPFPAAVEDCWAATQHIASQAAALAIDPNRLAVGGDSAGGNLAATIALLARDASLPLAFQLLIYPATQMSRTTGSHEAFREGYLLTAEMMRWYHDHYIHDPAHDLDWRASPLLHPDLSGLPPALVITAGFDPLRDEGLAYAQALSLAGTPAAQVCFERQIHGFITMARAIAEADTAVALCATALRRHLHGRA